jgi:aspartate racemase
MKTLGLIGGMSWHSTLEYYRIINEEIASRLGGMHSAELLVRSFDFAEIEEMQRSERWDLAAEALAAAGSDLEHGGAGALLICTNGMHKVADEVQAAVDIPVLHIADALADAALADGHETVGVLGARFTMLGEYYVGRLRDRGLEVIVPDAEDREVVDGVIFAELVRGVLGDESRAEYLRIIEQLRMEGADAIILGCTEIPLLVHQEDTAVPLYDSTRVHALAGVTWMLG